MPPTKTLTEGQRAYEAKRAAKAGMSLEKWLASKDREREAEAKAKLGRARADAKATEQHAARFRRAEEHAEERVQEEATLDHFAASRRGARRE